MTATLPAPAPSPFSPRTSPRRLLLAAAGVLAASSAALGAGTASAAPSAPGAARSRAPAVGEWTTYGGSNSRQSDQSASPPLRPLRVRWHSPRLDGGVYGEPLILGGGVFVATEEDTVYKLDASNGRIVWSRHLGSPVPAGDLPCGDIGPSVGVTSTMVVDRATDELFVAAAVDVGGTYRHEVLALSSLSGHVLWRRQVDLSWWDSPAQLQRTGLTLADGRVVVGYGGNFGDCAAYKGTVLGVPESGRGPVLSYVVPTAREGAVWAPSGISANKAGDLFFATGNGASTSSSDFDEGDSVVELSPSFRRLAVFAPANWLADNADDGDLGSAAPMLLPGNRALIVGKGSTGYLLDTNRLGGVGGQEAETTVCFSQGGDAYLAPLAYVACPGASLTAVRVGARSLAVAWKGPAGTGGSPTIAAGIVWVVNGGTLYGLAPRSGKELVSSPAIATEHFAAPSAGEGLLVIGGTDQVEAFEGPRGWHS